MNINQNKAPQTVAVRGYADNALMAASSRQTKRGFIIAKNLIKPIFYSNNLLGFGVGVGYSATSLKTWQHPASVLRFFCTPFMAARLLLARGLLSMGVLAIGNDPADHVGESTPTLIRWFSISKHGGLQ